MSGGGKSLKVDPFSCPTKRRIMARRFSAETKLRANSDAQDFIEPIDRDNIYSVTGKDIRPRTLT